MTKKKSLAPFGDTTELSKFRLGCKDPQYDPENIMMRLWEEENRRNSMINFGSVPLEAILRELKVDEQTGERKWVIPKKISERDRHVVAATLQWLATNCGRCFLEEFQKRVQQAYKDRSIQEKKEFEKRIREDRIMKG